MALAVKIRGVRGSKLVVLDIERGKLRTFDSPPDQTWHTPEFSPSGDRLVFFRLCVGRCVNGRKGYHIAILDLKTGVATTRTTAPDLFRRSALISPGGRFAAYSTLRFDNTDGRLPARAHSRWLGVLTDRIQILDLKTGLEHEISFENFGIHWFLAVWPTGFLDEKTLVLSGTWPRGSSPLIAKLKQRAKDGMDLTPGQNPESVTHPYVLKFDRPFTAATGLPRPETLDLLKTDWIRTELNLRISVDAGLIAFIDRSERDRQKGEGLFESFEYDVYLGDTKAVRQVTFLRTKMRGLTISRSGNRVAFLVDKEHNHQETLWMLDVATGKVWQTGLKERLRKLYPPQDRSKN